MKIKVTSTRDATAGAEHGSRVVDERPGRHANTIQDQIDALFARQHWGDNSPDRQPVDSEDQDIRDMLDDGWSAAEVADYLASKYPRGGTPGLSADLVAQIAALPPAPSLAEEVADAKSTCSVDQPKPVLTKTDIDRIENLLATHLKQLVKPYDGAAARVDFEGLMKRTGLKERTLRRYIAGKIIPVYQAVEGGKLLFDLAAVERALKRYHRAVVGDEIC